MYVNPNEHIGRRIYFDGYYEGSEWRVLKKLITPSMCIFDIGANIGSWSLLFSKLAQEGTVYAIEPSTWFELLEKNILTSQEIEKMKKAHALKQEVISVDSFEANEYKEKK